MKGRLSKTNERAAAFVLAALVCMSLLASPARPSARTTAPARQSPGAHADAEVERGRQLYLRGDYAGAAKVLGAAAKRLKGDADAWYYLGLALHGAGKWKDAAKAFEKAVNLQPADAGARSALAYTLLRANKSREAEREARRAIELDANAAEARYVLGVLRFRESKFEQSIEHADAALRAKPAAVAAAFLKGEALVNLYWDQSENFRETRPYPVNGTKQEQKDFTDARNAALEPVRVRMREAADTLEAFVKSQPNHADAASWKETVESLRIYGRLQPGGEKDASGVYASSAQITKAIIIKKPEPGYTEDARKSSTRGMVRVRAVLGADGKVRNIVAIRRLSHGLTEKAIEAARRIKFTPAMKDGVPVSQWIVLEYNFNIY